MSDVLDVRGQPCPMPVVRTRKAMETGGGPGETLTVLVSKRDQVDNVTRMADRSGWQGESRKEGDHYVIRLTPPAEGPGPVDVQPEDLVCAMPAPGESGKGAGVDGASVVVVGSETMGRGSAELGGVLIRAFLGVIKELDHQPRTILFYNSGVKLVIDGSPVLEEIRELAGLGIELLVCGTCLDYYGLKDRVRIGTVSNMFDIATVLLEPGNTVVM